MSRLVECVDIVGRDLSRSDTSVDCGYGSKLGGRAMKTKSSK